MAKMQQVVDGLLMLARYGNYLKEDVSVGFDVFYAGGPTPEELGTIAEKRLNELGWDWNKEYDCWQIII
jgi:hypothetical protein